MAVSSSLQNASHALHASASTCKCSDADQRRCGYPLPGPTTTTVAVVVVRRRSRRRSFVRHQRPHHRSTPSYATRATRRSNSAVRCHTPRTAAFNFVVVWQQRVDACMLWTSCGDVSIHRCSCAEMRCGRACTNAHTDARNADSYRCLIATRRCRRANYQM